MAFLTRLPIPAWAHPDGRTLAAAMVFFPLVGALLGAGRRHSFSCCTRCLRRMRWPCCSLPRRYSSPGHCTTTGWPTRWTRWAAAGRQSSGWPS
ncbi:adenosylcobinamide-GDP ribazoletransferase [Chloracidobacterium aggregatum]|uniref:adenosylcobinamide-GDP ribazoletransferase n=1 Tax=Chloracidobacterium aggregatum TaxID=2851959 RepID=UPI00387E4560